MPPHPPVRIFRVNTGRAVGEPVETRTADRGNSTLCIQYKWGDYFLASSYPTRSRKRGDTVPLNSTRTADAGQAPGCRAFPTFSDIARFKSSVLPVGIGPPSRLGRRGGDGEAVSLSGGPISASRESRELARQGHLTGHEDPRFAPRATGIAACARGDAPPGGSAGRVGAARWRRRRLPWVRAACRRERVGDIGGKRGWLAARAGRS
jgi:hypothetical protein